MFKKNKLIEMLSTSPQVQPLQDEKLPSDIKQNNTTVIAKNVCFEGNILSGGQVHICGRLKGSIDATDGIIKIIRGGLVEGDITCQELIVNGDLVGHCICDSLEIAENGKVTGIITYNTLTIKKGGEFSGQAETLPQGENASSNVTNITTEAQLTFQSVASETH